jgi:hypothetical protein
MVYILCLFIALLYLFLCITLPWFVVPCPCHMSLV